MAEKAGREEAERMREAERRHRVADSLAGAMAALNSNQSLDQVLDHIAGHARQVLNNQAVAIFRMDGADATLTLQVVESLPFAEAPGAEPTLVLDTLKRALAARQTVALPDIAATPAENGLSTPGAKGTLTAAPGAMQYRALLALPIEKTKGLFGL
jgi:hypothetical protein